MLQPLLARCTFAEGDGSLTIACSGGPDSSALAVLAAATGREVLLCHIDHGLRANSADDADVIATLASLLGASWTSTKVVVALGANLEARARAARKRALPSGAATGHTLDDQAETVLLNLLRGAGAKGLGAMRPGPDHPILGLRRSETHGLCHALGLTTVRDVTNDDDRFVRNRIRHEVLPLLDDLARRDVAPLLDRTARLARDDDDYLTELANMVDVTSIAALRSAPLVLRNRALRSLLAAHRDGYPPSTAELSRLDAVIVGDAVAAEFEGGVRIRRSQGRLHVVLEGQGKVPRMHDESTSPPAWAKEDIGEAIVTPAALAQRVRELGEAITADYQGEPPLLVGVLKGAMLFMSDLCREISLTVDVDFMAVSSYGSATKTSGIVRIVKDLEADLTGRHVLVVEDIIDSGLTLNYLRKYLAARKPKSVEVCALLLKEGEQRITQELKYVGFSIPADFVVGYGLDVAERYRNLKGIYRYIGATGDA